MLYYKLTALNGPIHRKIRTKTNPIQTADRWMRHIEAPRSLSNNLWVETMLKNKSVINVRPVSVGIYDLLTSQVAYFPHLPQLLAPGSQLASPLQILTCNWRCFTVNWTTLHTTGLADMAPATPSHGPGLQLSPCDIFKCLFLNENIWISLKFVPKVRISNIPALVQIMAWRRPGDKPLSEPILVNLPTHICIIRPWWVEQWKSSAKKSWHCNISTAAPLA